MAVSDTSSRAAEAQERRRAFQRQVPERFCPECLALTYEDDESCFDCDAARPAAGWPPLSQSPDRWVGELIAGRYLVTRPVAMSSSARVYRADSRIIPRSFAIKIMDVSGGPSLDQEGLRRRLKREMESLSSLRNPHIVGFYDVVELDHRHLAFVMDLVEGLSLHEYVSVYGPAPPTIALGLLRQLSNGVFEAHELGLVHRALKPSNVMIEKLPAGDDFVRILDFGVVWVRGTVATTGAFDVSPVFSSPEQVRDDPTDARTDIYSIGALAFFLLTGRPPFQHDSIQENVNAVLSERPPAVSSLAGASVFPDLDAFVARLLSKHPNDRPEDLSEVISLLDDLIDSVGQLEDREFHREPTPGPTATLMGAIPTLGEASSPVLKLEASEMSDVSEATIGSESPTDVAAVACRGNFYSFIRGDEVHWIAGDDRHVARWTPPSPVLAMEQTESFALFGLEDGTIARVSRDGVAETMFQDPRRAPMLAVASDSSGTNMVAGSQSGRLYAYRPSGGWGRLGAGDSAVTALALNERGNQFAVARGDSLQIFSSTTTHSPTFPLPVDGMIRAVSFSPDDYLIAVLTSGGLVVLESVLTGQEFMRIDTGNPDLLDVTFSQENHLLGLFREGAKVVLKTLT